MRLLLTNAAYCAAGLVALPVLVFLVAASFVANCLLWAIEKVHP